MSEENKNKTEPIEQSETTSTSTPSTEDFDVIFASKTDDGTIVTTSAESFTHRQLSIALSVYDPKNDNYSVYLNEGVTPSKTISVEEIDDLLTNTQNDLNKVLKINAYNRKLINKNDIVGKTVESIDTNINTDIKITYGRAEEGRNKKKQLELCKSLIKDANEGMKTKQLTRNAVTTSYVEGNWIAYLRHENNDNYTVDFYPLGVCEISDYNVNGEPVVLFDINNLRSRLSKTYKRNKKNKALFFNTMEEEVKANYPKEVYDAFVAKEKYAKLDPKYTGVIRINNLNRKYGVSPIARAYTDLNMLDTFADTDRINSKAKGKKIIHQKMRKEVMGQDYNKDFFPELSYAHQNFMNAWKQSTVVVTSPPTVEEIKYVEPSVEMYNYDEELMEFNFELTQREIGLLASLMYEVYFERDEALLKAFKIRMTPSDLNQFSPANERASFENMLQRIKNENTNKIAKYVSTDRNTGKRKMIDHSQYDYS